MAFQQLKLDRSILQSRRIFNKYIYKTDDTKAAVTTANYFKKSRFITLDSETTNGNGWKGGIIECSCSDGYFVGKVSDDGLTVTTTTELVAGATKTYWFYASDTATNPVDGGTKISHGAGATTTFLTNNNLGTMNSSYNPDSNPNLWNSATNKFDFTSLKVGDVLDIRLDIIIDHAAAQETYIVIDLAEGQASPYTLRVGHDYYKTASTNVTVTCSFKLPFISQSTIDGGARMRFESIAAATIVVNGWYYEVTEV